MAEIELICENCGEPFLGTPNRKTCCIECRRSLEIKRQKWDEKCSYVHFCEVQAAGSPWSTPAERTEWAEKAIKERERVVELYGERP